MTATEQATPNPLAGYLDRLAAAEVGMVKQTLDSGHAGIALTLVSADVHGEPMPRESDLHREAREALDDARDLLRSFGGE